MTFPQPQASKYTLLLLAGIAVSFLTWTRLARRDARLPIVYLGALLGAFTGAKLVYLAAEGWMFAASPDRWMIWATGKTILGALLGGYLGVELAKMAVGYTVPTGDLFAIVAPIGIILGRIGCLLHGCCLGRECSVNVAGEAPWWALRDRAGVPRWPAVPAEIAFNVVMLGIFLELQRRGLMAAAIRSALRGQLFHIYLIAYGAFRFVHEFFRDTPHLILDLSGYHLASLACIALGVIGFVNRAKIARQPVAVDSAKR